MTRLEELDVTSSSVIVGSDRMGPTSTAPLMNGTLIVSMIMTRGSGMILALLVGVIIVATCYATDEHLSAFYKMQQQGLYSLI